MAFLDLTDETGGNANGVGGADVVTERLASKIDRPATYLNALTSTTPQPVKLLMVMPTDRLAMAALEMGAEVSQRDARFVRIRNTLKLRRIHASEALLPEVEKNERLHIVKEARCMRFEDDGVLVLAARTVRIPVATSRRSEDSSRGQRATLRLGKARAYRSGTGGLAVELLPRACIAVGRMVISGT
jgi:hypothetical protein